MNRRVFTKLTTAAAGLLALGQRPSTYQPCGYLHCSDPGARWVDKVYLDGVEIKDVFELDDVQGWLRHWHRPLERQGDHLRSVYRTGTVRVTYLPRPR